MCWFRITCIVGLTCLWLGCEFGSGVLVVGLIGWCWGLLFVVFYGCCCFGLLFGLRFVDAVDCWIVGCCYGFVLVIWLVGLCFLDFGFVVDCVKLLAVKLVYLICVVVNCWLTLDVLGIRCLVNSCVLLLIVIIAHFVGLGLGLGCLLLDGLLMYCILV